MSSEPDQPELFPEHVQLRRVDPERNMRRFYLMTMQCNLFGGATLVREWGRVGSAGKVRLDHFSDVGRAVGALAETLRLKQRRGYRSRE